MWWLFALMSAVFAALTSVFAKVGLDGVNSTLATALRTIVVLAMSWLMVFITTKNVGPSVSALTGKNWLFLTLSGLATGASWLCYYRAVQMGPLSKVAPIDKLSVVLTVILAFLIFREKPDLKTVGGCLLIAAGIAVML